MNLLRKYRNRYITGVELVSALDDTSFLISPAHGFTDGTARANYRGVYFTLSSVNLNESSKNTSAGTIYNVSLEFSFPNFVGADQFRINFAQLAEIRITLNTGAVIRLNKNDIALNTPIAAEFQSNVKTVGFSAQLSQISPFTFNEQ